MRKNRKLLKERMQNIVGISVLRAFSLVLTAHNPSKTTHRPILNVIGHQGTSHLLENYVKSGFF